MPETKRPRFFQTEDDRLRFADNLSDSFVSFTGGYLKNISEDLPKKYADQMVELEDLEKQYKEAKSQLDELSLINNPDPELIRKVRRIKDEAYNINSKIDFRRKIAQCYKLWYENPDKFLTAVNVCSLALDRAIKQVVLDIEMLDSRRSLQNGVSPGKIAGCILFRLCRFTPVRCIDIELLETELGMKINTFLSIEYILSLLKLNDKISIDDKAVTEIAYSIDRRHANQETLASMLDLLISTLSDRNGK